MTTNPDAQAIVTGIVALAPQPAPPAVTAEGVETAAQRDALAAIECDYSLGGSSPWPVPADVGKPCSFSILPVPRLTRSPSARPRYRPALNPEKSRSSSPALPAVPLPPRRR